jgi:hypothetical protein
MRQKLRSHLTYANVMATVAVFLALGGAAAIAATSVCTGGLPCVNSDDIIDGEVKNPDLATGAVGGAKLASNSVGTGKVVDNSLQGVDLLDGTVATADLAAGAVTPAKVGTIPAARAFASTLGGQTVASGQFQTLRFESEDFDTANLHNSQRTPSRLTAPIDGIYQVSAGVVWGVNATGRRELLLSVNGTVRGAQSAINAISNQSAKQNVSDPLKLSAGDFVEAKVFQSSGGDLAALTGASRSTFLAMTWIGPG